MEYKTPIMDDRQSACHRLSTQVSCRKRHAAKVGAAVLPQRAPQLVNQGHFAITGTMRGRAPIKKSPSSFSL
jgi:hypothetical protein